ncbi:MAG TPA: zf-HC2 domain-containing protein [Bryobacteraceae bacterium]|nr:zf-HC2 domain-containing protein [Bryobacteraceae bacterium]
MSCEKVQKQISSLLDRTLTAGEREGVLAHIESCRECSAHAASLESLRTELRSLSRPPIPEDLRARLRVMASHERERRLVRLSLSSRMTDWAERARLCFDNLMRPLALPFAGGSLMALITFSLLVPSLSFPHNFGDQSWFKPPIPESTYVPGVVHNAWIVRSDIAVPQGMNAVELTIDEQGKVRDYTVAGGSLTPDLQSIIMLPPPFRPATVLGLPIPSKVKVIEVMVPNNRS